MELTGAAEAARKDWTLTRRGSVRVERWVRAAHLIMPFIWLIRKMANGPNNKMRITRAPHDRPLGSLSSDFDGWSAGAPMNVAWNESVPIDGGKRGASSLIWMSFCSSWTLSCFGLS